MKGSVTVKERENLLEISDKIVFISKWVKKKFFEGLKYKDSDKAEIIYHSINKQKNFIRRKNI